MNIKNRVVAKILMSMVAAVLILGLGTVVILEQRSKMEVVTPLDGAELAFGVIPVLVRFPPQKQALPETFRASLNGQDVTEDFAAVATNGAGGRLYLLEDGENQLRLEVVGHAWWSSEVLVEEVKSVRFYVHRPNPIPQG